MLRIAGIVCNSEIFDTVTIQVIADNCTEIINDWAIQIDGCDATGIDFLYSEFPDFNPCQVDACAVSSCPEPFQCTAYFSWDTTLCPDGPKIVTATAGDEQSEPVPVEVKNFQLMNEILSRKLKNSRVVFTENNDVTIQLSQEEAEFIEELSYGILVDIELGGHERFTIPISGMNRIIGENDAIRVLDLESYRTKRTGETLSIELTPEAASFFNEEFSNKEPKISVLFETIPLATEAPIRVKSVKDFSALHALVVEEP